MKLSNFRISKRTIQTKQISAQTNTARNQTASNMQAKFSNLIDSLQVFANNFANATRQPSLDSQIKQSQLPMTKPSSSLLDLAERDRFVIIDLPVFSNGQILQEKLQAWIGQVCQKVLGVAFHYYTEKIFNYEQMKAFASQSLLRNISMLVDKYDDIQAKDLKFIDKAMEKKVLPYLKSRYPLAVEKYINKALSKSVYDLNNSQALVNDYFSSSEVQFSYRENGRYDDFIMRFLNQIISKVDMKVESEDTSTENASSETTNFKQFESLLSEIFQKSFDQSWINSQNTMKMQNNTVPQKQRQKYRSIVQQYTSYLIGRKVSQNYELFTETQIESGILTVKSPQILRIMQKLCEQLWQKIQNSNYFTHRKQGFMMVGTNTIGTLFPWLKQVLNQLQRVQKQEVLKFISEIEDINFLQQIQILKNELDNEQDNYIQRYERVSGKFACKIFNNFESFIVLYLNQLIHSLLKISKVGYETKMKQFPHNYPRQFNLLSCKIGDLIRCKYESRQKQVLRIFKQLQQISTNSPNKLKIIRIKNRLNLGTNDILINVKFNNSIICEIQLRVNSEKSQFMKCSNQINHFIYQLQRSKFGPILEACSIWKNNQKRSQQFDSMIARQSPRKQLKIHQQSLCITFKKDHEYKPETKPFICSQCSKHYCYNSYITEHITCTKCKYWKCAKCLIRQNVLAQNTEFFLNQSPLKDQCKFWKPTPVQVNMANEFPKYGIAIYKKRTTIEMIVFKRSVHSQKVYLLHRMDENILILKQFVLNKDIRKFYQDWLIFQISQTAGEGQLKFVENNISENQISRLILTEYIKRSLKNQKQQLFLNQQRSLCGMNIDTILHSYPKKLKFIKNIQLASLYMDNLDLLSINFINLTKVNLDYNKIKNMEKLCSFKKIEEIKLQSNNIQKIPLKIHQLQNLTKLNVSCNTIQIIPQNFTKLKHLHTFEIRKNLLVAIPEDFYQLSNLKVFNAQDNRIEQFSNGLAKHAQLTMINLENNQIHTIPEVIQNLSNLKELVLNKNHLKQFPLKAEKMTKLEKLQLRSNLFSSLPAFILTLTSLLKLSLEKNKIQIIPDQLSNLQKLVSFDIGHNLINNFALCILKLPLLADLRINGNQIQELPANFDSLKKLKTLYIDQNKLKKIHPSIGKLSLQTFKYLNNPLQQAPFFVLTFKNQTNIVLQKMKITQIPDIISKAMKVNLLNLSKNQLSTLPRSFLNMTQLTNLDLSQNSFTSIPLEIFKLKKITFLKLNKNKIRQIPSAVEQLENLESLLIAQNQIQFLYQNIGNLPKLKYLLTRENKIRHIPNHCVIAECRTLIYQVI